VRVVVEVPRGSQVKLKYDRDTGTFVWSRPMPLGIRYPYDFGFLPGTLADDGDELDALVFTEVPSFPGVVVPSRPIGALRVRQQRDGGPVKRNDRIIVVPAVEHRRAGLRCVSELPARVLDEIQAFFAASLVLTGKTVQFGGWAAADEAAELIAEAQVRAGATPPGGS
jgi:inorganic pyrophosphatase